MTMRIHFIVIFRGTLCPSISALRVQLIENLLFNEVLSDSGEVSTTSSGTNERAT